MKTSFRPASLRLCVFALISGSAAAGPRDLTAEFAVPEGLEVTLWAETPQLFNPTNIDIDARGRVWVAEAVNYRLFRKQEKGPPPRPEGDRIVILEDTDGDGACDSSKVFVQDPDLAAPLGVCVLGNRVIVSNSPSAFVYTDTDGDDKADKKEILLTGFGGKDHDHGLHAFTAGPDGKLYFNVGNAGPHIVTDKSGWTLRSGSCYGDRAPAMPGQKSDDGRICTGGLVLRCNPDGTGLEVLAHNFRNNYEVAVDSFGNLWQNDNDDDVVSCRVSWIMEGGNYGFFSPDGSRTWRADMRPGQSIPTAHWHQEDPGVCPPGFITGSGAPTGIVVYEGDLLPEKFRGMVLSADAGRNTVFGMTPHPDGAGYRLEPSVFLSSRKDATDEYVWNKVSEDTRTWFRPSDVAVGTDGAVYVADWYDPIVGGHDIHDAKAIGRILRVAPKGSHPEPPRTDLSTVEGAIKALCSPAVNVRRLGWDDIRRRGSYAAQSLNNLLSIPDARMRARALWLTSVGLKKKTASTLLAAFLHDSDPEMRTTALRALAPIAGVPQGLEDNDCAGVWREGAIQVARRARIHRQEGPELWDRVNRILGLSNRLDGKDRWFLEALGLGAEGVEGEACFPINAASFKNPDPLSWSDADAGIVWRLHPPSAVPALVTRVKAESLPFAARKQALDAIAFCFHADAANAILDLALNGPEAIREHALWWARFRADKEWKDFGIAAKIPSEETAEQAATKKRLMVLQKRLNQPGTPPEEKEKVALELASTQQGAYVLFRCADRGLLAKELLPKVTEAIYRNPDPGVRALATQYFPRPAKGGAPLPPVAELLKMSGDAKRGREIFFGATASCSKCHKVGDQGGDIGPDLTNIRGKLGRDGILDSVLNPSATIAFGYEPWAFVTKDEEVITGFLLAEGDPVIVKDTAGNRRSIPHGEITERKRQASSVMPDNVALGLTAQELMDIVEFLTTVR